MKSLLLFAVLLYCLHLSRQTSIFSTNCPLMLKQALSEGCKSYVCSHNDFTGHKCSTPKCESGKLKTQTPADNSKTYPDCCAKLTCEH